MPLPRYNPSEVRLQTGGGVGHRAEAQMYQTLSQKMDQWADYTFKEGAKLREEEGKREAEKVFLSEGSNAKLNEDRTIFGESYNKALETMQAKKISIDNAAAMEKLYEANSDNPDNFVNVADAHYKGMMAEMPEHLKTEFMLDYEANKAFHLGNARKNAKKLADDELLATANNFHELQYNKATQASREGATNRALLEIEKAEDSLLEAEVNGIITANQYETKVNELYKAVADAKYQGINDRNIEEGDLDKAQKFVTDFRKTKDTLYSDEEREALADEMQIGINAEIKRRKAKAKEAEEFATQELKSHLEIVKSGGKSAYSDAEVDRLMTVSNSKQTIYDVRIQREIQKKVPGWRGMSVTEMEDSIASIKSGTLNATQQELVTQMEKHLKEKSAMIKNDVVGLAIKEEVIPAPKYGMSASDGVDNLINGLNSIDTFLIKEQYGDNAVNVLTKEDAQSWKSYFEAPGNTDEKINTIQAIAELSRDKAKAFYNQIAGKDAPTFGFIANLTLAGNKDAAAIALQGKNSGITLNEPSVFKKDIQSKLSGVWNHDKSGTILNRDTLGLINYNRGVVANGNDQLDASDVMESTFGTVETYNGKDIIIPKGVSKSDFDDWLENLDSVIDNNLAEEIRDMNSWFGTKTIQLHQAGNGKYRVYKTNNGKGYYVLDRDGKNDLILDYSKGVYE